MDHFSDEKRCLVAARARADFQNDFIRKLVFGFFGVENSLDLFLEVDFLRFDKFQIFRAELFHRRVRSHKRMQIRFVFQKAFVTFREIRGFVILF